MDLPPFWLGKKIQNDRNRCFCLMFHDETRLHHSVSSKVESKIESYIISAPKKVAKNVSRCGKPQIEFHITQCFWLLVIGIGLSCLSNFSLSYFIFVQKCIDHSLYLLIKITIFPNLKYLNNSYTKRVTKIIIFARQ